MSRNTTTDDARVSPPLWLLGLAYSVIAAAICLLDRPLHYVADNRFEVYESPWRVLARSMSTWDPSRGFGAPRDDVWLATTLPAALLRSLGLSAVLSQRLFHAACLVVLALGVAVLVRDLRRTLAVESAVAGLLAMLSPFTISFLIPSNLSVMVCLTPWLMVIAGRGVSGNTPWRHAAAFALIVFIAGNSDTPGLLYSGVAVALFIAGLIVVEGVASWRRTGAWVLMAGALSAGTAAWALVKAAQSADALSARLAATELPSTSATASSWSESLRGLGNWLSYFVENGRLTKPQTIAYFEQPVVIAATFAVPIVALVVLWRNPWRARLVFGGLVLVSVIVMAGGFPAPNRSPFGSALLWAMDNSTTLASLRNTYKAGAGLIIGLSVLAAVGLVGAVRALRARSRVAGFGGIALCAALVVGSAWPAVSGNLYHPDERVDSIPIHWHEATRYLNELQPAGRSLIIPSVSQAWYRWGYTGDDIFDAMLSRNHATATGWMLSTRPAHAALEALTLATQPPAYRPGIVGPMARRLGITEIVLRNDLDWRRNNTPRPAAYLALRTDPDLELVAAFGPTGSNLTADPLDTSAEAAYERSLPPVEIYRVRSSATGPTLRAQSDDTVVVAGDAYGWGPLISSGVIQPHTRLVASGAMDDDGLLRTLESGARVIYTDSARRRVLTLLHHEPQFSQTLSEFQDLDRPAWATFDGREGAQSVAWFRDAARIEGSAVRLGGNRNDRRPSLAFDGNPSTAWAVPSTGLAGPTAYVEVHLRRSRDVSRIAVQTVLAPNGTPTVRTVEVRLSDGRVRLIRIGGDGRGTLSFEPTATLTVRLSIKDLSTFGREAGLAEVDIDDLDLREFIEVPTDLYLRGAQIASQLAGTETGYSFRRVARAGLALRQALVSSAYDEETSLNRRFSILRPTTFSLSGTVVLTAATSDELLAEAIGSPVTASSPRSPGVLFDRLAVNLIDGDESTPWVGAARSGAVVSLRFPRQAVRTIRVVIPDDQASARVARLTTEVNGRYYAATPQVRRCDTAGFCSRTAVFQFPVRTELDRVDIRIAAIDRTAAIDPEAIRIGEVLIGDDVVPRLDPSAPLNGTCIDLGIAIRTSQGDTSASVRLDGSVGDLLQGRAIRFSGCDDMALPAGDALLTTTPGSPIDELRLMPNDWGTAGDSLTTTPVRIAWQSLSPDRWVGAVSGTGTVELATKSSFDPGWVLTAGSRRITATELDAANSFTFTARDGEQVTLSYEPARTQRLARLLTLLAVMLCAAVIAGPLFSPPRRPSAALPPGDPLPASVKGSLPPLAGTTGTGVIVLSIAAGFAVAGWIGLIVAAATMILLARAPHQRAVIGIAPVALLLVAGLQTVIAADTVSILYARERWVPSVLARLAVVFAIPAVLAAISAERQPRRNLAATRRQPGTAPRGRHWPYVAVIVGVASTAAVAAQDLPVGVADAFLANVRHAVSFNAVRPSAPPALDIAPLGVLFAAFMPTPTSVWTALAAAATVLAASVAVQRWCSLHMPSAVAAAVATAWVITVQPPANSLMASALVLGAIALTARRPYPATSSANGVVTGLLLGLSALAQPSALLAVVAVAVLHRRIRPALTSIAMSLGTCAAWLGIVARHASLDDVRDLIAEVQWAGPVIAVAAIATVAAWWTRRRRPA